MGIPQVPDQVKRAPTLALRAVFSGIGRILLAADRPQANTAGPESGADAAWQQRQRLSARRHQRSAAAAPAPASSRWRSLDQTGNVRLLSAEDLDDDYDAGPAADGQALRGRAVSLADDGVPADGGSPLLPLPNYDTLSLASIRARLRGLDADQLRILADYERKNEERPDVLGMFERRIEKLEAGG
jgi:hypothetical protein